MNRLSYYQSIKYILRTVLYYCTNFFLGLFPKKKKLVLFNAWFGQKYFDNTRYVYEYLINHSDYKALWLTRSEDVFLQLKRDGKPVAKVNSLKATWSQIRAQAVFSTMQFSDYNTWLLSKCIFIDLSHGHPIKDPGHLMRNHYDRLVTKSFLNRNYYYAIVSSNFSKSHYHDAIDIPDSHIFISDFARNDVLFEESLRRGKNEVIDQIKGNRKAIVYMPTHRSEGKIVMNMNDLLPLADIQSFCEKNNYVFLIKKHYYHSNEVEDLDSYPSIFDITNEEIDPQVILFQADMLISDYSACFIDYMLLKRPIIFYHYDFDYFTKKERTFYIDFKKIDIAPIAYTKEDLLKAILEAAVQEDSYLERRMRFAQETYFDNIDHSNACQKIKVILDGLMQRYYAE